MPIEHVGHFTGTEESEESHDEGDGEEDEVRDGDEEEGEPGRLHRVQGRSQAPPLHPAHLGNKDYRRTSWCNRLWRWRHFMTSLQYFIFWAWPRGVKMWVFYTVVSANHFRVFERAWDCKWNFVAKKRIQIPPSPQSFTSHNTKCVHDCAKKKLAILRKRKKFKNWTHWLPRFSDSFHHKLFGNFSWSTIFAQEFCSTW